MLAGCHTTGGTLLGLFPAPKFTKGEIERDVYTAPDQSFSVGLPHKDGSYEYTYMQIKEELSAEATYVSFGPAALDLSIYRVGLVPRRTPEARAAALDDWGPQMVGMIRTQLESAYQTPLVETEAAHATIGPRPARSWCFTQRAPVGTASNREETYEHAVYVIDFEAAAVIVWVQSVRDGGMPPVPARTIAESVVVN